MHDSGVALVVMLSNYFHDVAVAFLFAASLLSHLLLRYLPDGVPPGLVKMLGRVAWVSLAWILAGGGVRAYFYQDYEWVTPAGDAQILALAVKHVLLVVLTVWGLVGIRRLRRAVRQGGPA